MKGILTFLIGCFLILPAAAQTVTKDIRSFGAKGDGKTDDHDAFVKAAAFFNQRKGNGKLVISKGTYIVGRQQINKNGSSFGWEGKDVLHFSGINNFTIEGQAGAIVKYKSGLKYGSFDPANGQPHNANGYFVNPPYAASLGHCIFLDQCTNVTISGVELNGNMEGIQLGGSYGDVGRQLPHYGVFIQNSRNIKVDRLKVHHFGLDGICVANKAAQQKDAIVLSNSTFEYNARQGLSWIGGNDLTVSNCGFNHIGKAVFSSPPGAGVDIEAEYGPCRNGHFIKCTFNDNTGCCLVADSGDSGYCSFDDCTFWSSTTWSVWVTKPAFTFNRCNIYGPIVHGFDAPSDDVATKYFGCHFEDKPYNGVQPTGEFLIETNNMRRVRFENCTMVTNFKKWFWISCPSKWKTEEKYQLINCKLTMNNANFPAGSYASVLRGAFYKNCTFTFTNKEAKKRGYYLNQCCEPYNVDGGGNSLIFAQ